MTTWQLLYRFFPDNAALKRSPIFARETKQTPVWGPLTQLAARLPVPLIVGIFLFYFLADFPTLLLVRGMVFFVALRVCLMMPSMLYLVLPLALTLAPTVVREREQHTWETLRDTPLSTGDIIQEKTAGALWWMRIHLNDTIGTTILAGVVVAVIGLAIGMGGMGLEIHTTTDYILLILVVLLLAVGGTAAYLLDRAQQLVLMILIVLAVSASRRSLRDALPLAVATVSGIWMVDVGIGWLVLLLQSGPLTYPIEIHVIILVLFSPIIVYLIELPLGMMIVVSLLTLIVRETMIRLMWQWTVEQASVF